MSQSRAERFAMLPSGERQQILAKYSADQLKTLWASWDWWARPEQLPPSGVWTYWLVLAGRGFGKTRTGAEWVREKSESSPIIHLVAPTASDLRKVMIEGPSGILSCFPADRKPSYEPSKGHKITFPSGNIAYGFSAEEPDRLRGPQCHAMWCDEVAAWPLDTESGKTCPTWDMAQFGLRLGDNPQAVVTTTPRPVNHVRSLIKDPNCVVTRGSTYENRANLAPAFFDAVISKYDGTRLGRQELNAEILDDVPGALWERANFDNNRIKFEEIQWDKIMRIVVGVDPAVTSKPDSDETGIVVCGLTRSLHVILLADRSLRASTDRWARAVVQGLHYFRADRIVGEVNNGGDLIEASLRNVDPTIPFRAVRATRGKLIRAEPVAALYEQNRVHHAGSFPELENQLCTWSPEAGTASPDRMDALVWAVTDLLIDQEQAIVQIPMVQPYVIR